MTMQIGGVLLLRVNNKVEKRACGRWYKTGDN